MIYFMDEGKKRKKYEIVVDKNGLEKLKVEIINNCSMIIHHDCNTTETPNYYDILRIRNYGANLRMILGVLILHLMQRLYMNLVYLIQI